MLFSLGSPSPSSTGSQAAKWNFTNSQTVPGAREQRMRIPPEGRGTYSPKVGCQCKCQPGVTMPGTKIQRQRRQCDHLISSPPPTPLWAPHFQRPFLTCYSFLFDNFFGNSHSRLLSMTAPSRMRGKVIDVLTHDPPPSGTFRHVCHLSLRPS